eukprot:751577-Hanusia_phi.AAC.5
MGSRVQAGQERPDPAGLRGELVRACRQLSARAGDAGTTRAVGDAQGGGRGRGRLQVPDEDSGAGSLDRARQGLQECRGSTQGMDLAIDEQEHCVSHREREGAMRVQAAVPDEPRRLVVDETAAAVPGIDKHDHDRTGLGRERVWRLRGGCAALRWQIRRDGQGLPVQAVSRGGGKRPRASKSSGWSWGRRRRPC